MSIRSKLTSNGLYIRNKKTTIDRININFTQKPSGVDQPGIKEFIRLNW